MAQRIASVLVSLVDGATRNLRTIASGARATLGSLADLNQVVELAGKALSALGDGFGLKGALEESGKLQDILTRVADVSGATAAEQQLLAAAVDDAVSKYRISAEAAATALSELTADGFSAADAVSELGRTLGFAQANALAFGEATGALGGILDAFGESEEQIGNLADSITAVARGAGAGTKALADGLTPVGVTAQQVGLDLQTTTAALGVLAQRGLEGGAAAKTFGKLMLELADPATKAGAAIQALGLDATNFSAVVQKLGTDSAAAEQVLSALGAKPAQALKVLLADGGGALSEFTTIINNSRGASEAAAATMQRTFVGALERLTNELDLARTKFLTPLLPKLATELTAFADQVKAFVASGSFTELSQQFTTFVVEGLNAFKAFLAEVDFKALGAEVVAFGRSAIPAIQGLAEAATTTAKAVGFIGDAVGLVKNTVTGVLNVAEASVSALAEGTAKGLRQAGVESEALDGVIATLSETTNTNIAEIGTSFKAAGENAVGLGEAVGVVGAAAATAAEESSKLAAALPSVSETAGAIGAAFTAAAEGIRQSATDLAATDPAARKLVDTIARIPQTAQAARQEFRALVDDASAGAADIYAALSNAINTAPGRAELESLRLELARMSQDGKLSADLVDGGLAQIEARLRSLKSETSELADEFKTLGITSQAKLDELAESARVAFEAIRDGAAQGKAATQDVTRAFEAYAQKQLQAAEGAEEWQRKTVEAALKNQGAAVGAAEALERLGLAGKAAGDQVEAGAGKAAEALKETASAADDAGTSVDRLASNSTAAAGALNVVGQAAQAAGGEVGFASQQFIDAANRAGDVVDASGRMADALKLQLEQFQREQRLVQEQIRGYDAKAQALDELARRYPLLDKQVLESLAVRRAELKQLQEAAEATRRVVQSSSGVSNGRGDGGTPGTNPGDNAPQFGPPLQPEPPSFANAPQENLNITVQFNTGVMGSIDNGTAEQIYEAVARVARRKRLAGATPF